MDVVAAQFGPWEVECLPADGGRLRALRYDGYDLLTPPPERFVSPAGDFGAYETRPVYGYDDCFPGVDPSDLPGHPGVRIRDHGELCWTPWSVTRDAESLACVARLAIAGWPVRFTRRLCFAAARLTWRFTVRNEGVTSLPFLHVMHALMPLADVTGLELPEFAAAVDEMRGAALSWPDPDACARHLRKLPRGQATMLLLRGVREGRFRVEFGRGLRLTVAYDAALFPTLGIWWNDGGYPGEGAAARTECAFEPMPGSWSSLERSWADGQCLRVGSGQSTSWELTWVMSV